MKNKTLAHTVIATYRAEARAYAEGRHTRQTLAAIAKQRAEAQRWQLSIGHGGADACKVLRDGSIVCDCAVTVSGRVHTGAFVAWSRNH